MGTPTPLRARNGLDNQSNVIRNIGNESSISAASAGANALRINSNTLQISDGAAWNNVGGGSSALRIVTLTDASTVTPNADTTDIGILTSLSQTTSFANPSGTPTNGQLLQIRITSSTSRSISFGTAYTTASSLSLATATTGGGVEDYIGFRYSSNASKWVLIGTTIGSLTSVTLDSLSGASTIASAATTDLSTTTAPYVTITGGVRITSFGTLANGDFRFLRFNGTPFLAHNSTSLILPTGMDISVQAGDTAIAQSLGSGNWVVSQYTRASGLPVSGFGQVLAARANIF
jgi:hypothetical protein